MTQPSQDVRLFAGAMSGTSADGVDVALVHIRGRGVEMTCQLLHHHHRAYDPLLKQRIFSIRAEGGVKLGELAELGRELSLACAAAVNEALLGAGLHAGNLSAVAAHGQTLFHDPPNTIQWFDPSLVAVEVGCPVVSDFRRADCAVGGQGAPLVPFADWVLFRDPAKSRVLLNVGGIANLTYLPAGGTLEQVIAFDTGPGNCISDYLMRQATPQGEGFDAGGELALKGTPNQSLAYSFLHRRYFVKDPPKTTDVPSMLALWEDTRHHALHDAELPLSDALATACLVTARSVATALRDFAPGQPDELIVSGGGANNRAIMTYLRQELKDLRVDSADDRGIVGAAKEALAFALLGAATLDGIPANVPNATGAYRHVVLGSVTPRP
jgi:anhydro-N-acetylmuramic acid kinase